METEVYENLEEQYPDKSRGRWIWFKIAGILEKLQSFKVHTESNTSMIAYCEYQFEKKNSNDLYFLGVLNWKDRTTPSNTDNFLLSYDNKWRSLYTSQDIQRMKNYCRKDITRFAQEERVIIGQETFGQQKNKQAQNKEAKMKEVVDMIKEIGVTEARWKWCRQGGSQQIFKNALSEYNFQITAERQKNMIDKAKRIIWKDWQQFVVNYLMAPVNNREILVVLDKNWKLRQDIPHEEFWDSE